MGHLNVKLYKKFNFPIKLLKTGFVTNGKCRQVPDSELLHHISFWDSDPGLHRESLSVIFYAFIQLFIDNVLILKNS